jgi:hypothetical protein
VGALNESVRRRKGGDAFDWLFLALAHAKLGRPDEARRWYDRAARRMDAPPPRDAALGLLRAEAASLLGLTKKKD